MAVHRFSLARVCAFALAAVVVAALVPPVYQASAATAPPACPELTILEQAEVEALAPGTPLIALTVEQGDTPTEIGFIVEHVQNGALQDGAPLVVARATSGSPVTESKGIWFGMSGSPVYTVGMDGGPDALVGAVAFGLAWDGTSPVAGLQPAYQMEKVRSYPSTTPMASSITISSTGAQKVAASTGLSSTQTQRFEPLAVPLTLSGSGRRHDLVKRAAEHAGLRVMPLASGTATNAAAAEPTTTAAGDTFAAAMSYGYMTSAAIGTTTYTCGDHAMAFGHPFFFSGRTHMGANAGTDAYVVRDGLGGSYKMAEVGGLVGRVDQDRAAGIRAALGDDLPLLPIITNLRAPDIAQSGEARSDLVESQEVPFLAWLHSLNHLDDTADMIGKGSSSLQWTVAGVTAQGVPFQLQRGNRYTSPWDITFESSFELFDDLITLQENRFTNIRFTNIQLQGSVHEDIREYRVKRVRVLRDGVWRVVDRLRVRRGELLQLRVDLATGTGTSVVSRKIRVPRRARGFGDLRVSGRSEWFDEEDSEDFLVECSFSECDEGGVSGPSSFAALVKSLANSPRNDVLTTRLTLFSENHETGQTSVWRRSRTLRRDRVVTGSVRIPVRVRR